MKKFLFILISVFLFSACGSKDGKITFSGTVKLENPDLINFTRLIVTKDNATVVDLKLNSPDFKLNLDKNSIYQITLSAPEHDQLETIIWTDETPSELTLTLSKIKHHILFDPFVIGNFNGFNPNQAISMEKLTETTWQATLPVTNGELQYQIMGVTEDQRPITGTQQDTYSYMGDSPYFMSVVYSNEDPATITFTAQLDEPQYSSSLTSTNSAITERAKAYSLISNNKKELTKAYINQYVNQLPELEINWDVLVKPVNEALFESTNKENSALHLAAYLDLVLNGYKPDYSAKVERLIFELGPMHPIWSLNQFYAFSAMDLSQDEQAKAKFTSEMSEKYPNDAVREVATYAGFLAADNAMDTEKKRFFYDKLLAEFPASQFVEYAKYQFNPDDKVVSGAQVPDFSVVSLDGKTTYSPSMFKGKFILMDFWATWCGPCVQEMPELHAVYEDFKGEKFDVLSLSFDEEIGAISEFRKNRFKMPWMHTFVEGGFENPIAEKFEVTGIPKPILINPEGKIVAMGIQLRGANLRKTLQKFIK